MPSALQKAKLLEVADALFAVSYSDKTWSAAQPIEIPSGGRMRPKPGQPNSYVFESAPDSE